MLEMLLSCFDGVGEAYLGLYNNVWFALLFFAAGVLLLRRPGHRHERDCLPYRAFKDGLLQYVLLQPPLRPPPAGVQHRAKRHERPDY